MNDQPTCPTYEGGSLLLSLVALGFSTVALIIAIWAVMS